MRLAAESDRIHAAGGEVIAISVDSVEQNAAMFRRWPTPHVTYVSDPDGATHLRSIDMFDPDERGGIGRPGLFVIAPDSALAHAYRGHDFADRRHDDDVIQALEALGLEAIEPPPGGPVDATVDVDLQGAFTPAMFGGYFRGNRSAAVAIERRAGGDEARSLAREHREMCDAFLEAWRRVRPR